MSERRYVGDYRLEDYVTPKGKVETRRIYQGTYYRFCKEEKAVHALGKRLCLISFGCLILFLPMLFNNTRIGRTAYVLVPIAFTFLPLYHTAAVGVRLQRSLGALTRQTRDLTDRRLRSAGVWLTVMLAADSLGCVIYWIAEGLQKGELLCVLGIFLSFLYSLVVLKMRTYAQTEPVDGDAAGEGGET